MTHRDDVDGREHGATRGHLLVFAIAMAALLLPGRALAQEAEIVLYSDVNFGGESITFNESEPDLDPYGWDNRAESIRVVAGTWRIFRDDDYQEINGPSFELTLGEYPDIEQNPGFPHDRMSAVRLEAAPEPQTAVLEVSVIDQAASACDAAARVEGATVTATSGDDDVEETTDADGTATFELAVGETYTIGVVASGCGTAAPRTVMLNGDDQVQVELPGCEIDHDLRVRLPLDANESLSRNALHVPVGVRNLGPDGPSRAQTLRLYRDDELIEARNVSGMCPDETRRMRIRDTDAQAGASYTYRAEIEPGDDANPDNDLAVASVQIAGNGARLLPPVTAAPRAVPDLEIDVEQRENPLAAGDLQIYDLTVRNEGDAPARGVWVQADLPDDLDYVSAEGPDFDRCFNLASDSHRVRCIDADIEAGGSSTITVRARLPASARAGHSLLFQATVDPCDSIRNRRCRPIEESNERNNVASAVSTTEGPGMQEYRIPAPAAWNVAHRTGFLFYPADPRGSACDHYDSWSVSEPRDGRDTKLVGTNKITPDLSDRRHVQARVIGGNAEMYPAKGYAEEMGVPGECTVTFELFAGRPLAEGWSVVRVEISRGTRVGGRSVRFQDQDEYIQIVQRPREGDSSLRTEIEMTAEGKSQTVPTGLRGVRTVATAALSEIVLRGPAKADWREAFE